MSTSTVELVELDQDVNDSLACYVQPCDNPPKWATKCRNCGSVGGLLCQDHKVELTITLEAWRIVGHIVECVDCHVEGVWTDVMEFVPV